MDDMFAFVHCPAVCLSWHENSQSLAGCLDTYISVNDSCQHDSYKDNTNVTDARRHTQDMFGY